LRSPAGSRRSSIAATWLVVRWSSLRWRVVMVRSLQFRERWADVAAHRRRSWDDDKRGMAMAFRGSTRWPQPTGLRRTEAAATVCPRPRGLHARYRALRGAPPIGVVGRDFRRSPEACVGAASSTQKAAASCVGRCAQLGCEAPFPLRGAGRIAVGRNRRTSVERRQRSTLKSGSSDQRRTRQTLENRLAATARADMCRRPWRRLGRASLAVPWIRRVGCTVRRRRPRQLPVRRRPRIRGSSEAREGARALARWTDGVRGDRRA